MKHLFALLMLALGPSTFGQQPPPEGLAPGVPIELARWRAAQYSDVRYKLNLTLEKMSPVLKGTLVVRVRVSGGDEEKGSGGGRESVPSALAGGGTAQSETRPVGRVPSDIPIIFDWRKLRGHEDKSTITNVTLNNIRMTDVSTIGYLMKFFVPDYVIQDDHLIFSDGVVAGENVIKLDFTSPILTSGSAITRYVDKEDGAEYIYSLFVPSDASTAFPVFDQPDLKARFTLDLRTENGWNVISNGEHGRYKYECISGEFCGAGHIFGETKPISTYVFAFAAGPWEKVSVPGAAATKSVPPAVAGGLTRPSSNAAATTEPSISPTSTIGNDQPPATAGGTDRMAVAGDRGHPAANAGGTDKMAELSTSIYVRKSQAEKFQPHAVEVFRLNREAVKYFEGYFDYKFPWPKYDLVLIPEFPFGGMEHAGATFLRESSIIFPQEPTKNDHISRALLMFHEASHQWFGDTVTMRWFDDLWLKEGFATFTAYKAMERVMPEMLAWKVFYERVKQAAYQTDSTRGTTAIYQPIANLSAAKSAYGNIVYNKAPAFLRQAEFYLGEDKFQTAVRAFLKKHEFGNAGWEDLVSEFKNAEWNRDIASGIASSMEPYWTENWINKRGVPIYRFTPVTRNTPGEPISAFFPSVEILQSSSVLGSGFWDQKTKTLQISGSTGHKETSATALKAARPFIKNASSIVSGRVYHDSATAFIFPNYADYGYGIFLLDEKSRDYVLQNIQNEKDPFLRTMMWGALWDSVREGELDPRVFVELVVKNIAKARTTVRAIPIDDVPELDESTVQLLLSRVSVAMNYYIPAPDIALTNVRASASEGLRSRVEDLLIERMQNAESLGQRITFYRAFLNVASSDKARGVLKAMLKQSVPPAIAGGSSQQTDNVAVIGSRTSIQPPATAGGTDTARAIPLKTKDRFDIVTKLLILGDPDAPKLLADLEKTETGDDAKRYAYAAKAGIPTAENKAKYWKDFTENKEISESWIEAAFGPWNSIRHSDLTLPYLQKALQELPNHKRNRKIFFVNGWLGAFIGGQRSEEALGTVNKFLADNPGLDNDLRLKILENVDVIERAVKIRQKHDR